MGEDVFTLVLPCFWVNAVIILHLPLNLLHGRTWSGHAMNPDNGINILESLELDFKALSAKGNEDRLGNCVLPHFSLPPASENKRSISLWVLRSCVGGRRYRAGWVTNSLPCRQVHPYHRQNTRELSKCQGKLNLWSTWKYCDMPREGKVFLLRQMRKKEMKSKKTCLLSSCLCSYSKFNNQPFHM